MKLKVFIDAPDLGGNEMKLKVFIDARCPGCGTIMTASNYRGNDIIQCLSDECPLNKKMYELPSVEVKEIKE